MKRHAVAVAGLCLALAACAPSATEKTDMPQGDGYDFFVLALSWSPSYCEAGGADANRQQCRAQPRHGFVVHGLWPQYESGWPEFCDSSEPARVPDGLVRDVIDIMPSAGLIGHQWRKHGSCAGMGQSDYFALVRAASEKVAVPERFANVSDRLQIAPAEVESAFIQANQNLPADGIAATCQDSYISEVRICLT